MHMINDGKRAALLQVCREEGLPDDAGERVFSAALRLLDFESDRRSYRRSPAQRCRDLEQIYLLARSLNTAVQGLDFVDRERIDDEFKASALRICLDPPSPLETVFKDAIHSNVLRIGDVLLTLASIAKAQLEAVPERTKGGAPAVLFFHANCLTKVARIARLHGIRPGQGNSFLRLCEAVFTAAGVKTDPSNAIRYFMRELAPIWCPIWEREEQAADDPPASELDAVETPQKKVG